jgi:cell division protein FtsB
LVSKTGTYPEILLLVTDAYLSYSVHHLSFSLAVLCKLAQEVSGKSQPHLL